jgi:hypothetical protein
MRPTSAVPLLALALIAVSCAGPTQLARRSERELRAGNVREAYDLARRGVDKDPEHTGARAALAAAAAQLVDESKGRVLALSATDTVAAARELLGLRELRGELGRYRVELPHDSLFDAREATIALAAAGIEYRTGEANLAAGHPKEAYRRYRAAEGFAASYGDVQEKLRRSHEMAMTRVAILPFENDVDVPGLSRAVADAMAQEIGSRLASDGFEFTEIVDPNEVYATMTVKEMDNLPAESVWRIAQGVDAGRVVIGRLHGLRASTNTWSFQYPIYRKITEQDTSGRSVARWKELRFDAIARERTVTLRWDLDVVEVGSRAVLAQRSEEAERVARVAWTDFRADGDCDDYVLVPPEREDGEEANRVRARWKECFGDSWTLPDMLERARNDRRRALYSTRYRDEFRSDSRRRPVLCGELPGENDLAFLALDGVWRQALATLKDLDPKD